MCDSWHYQPADRETLKIFGHINSEIQQFLEKCKKELPKVDVPTIKVGATGYWYSTGPIEVNNNCWFIDEVGRTGVIIGDTVAIQRYTNGDSMIGYKKNNFKDGSQFSITMEEIKNFMEQLDF